MEPCVFCEKLLRPRLDVHLETFEYGMPTVFSFVPLNPVTEGHLLFVPAVHVEDAAFEPLITGKVFEVASRYALKKYRPFNLITSAGVAATQSIRHLHVHYVPRSPIDDLHLPWTGQNEKTS